MSRTTRHPRFPRADRYPYKRRREIGARHIYACALILAVALLLAGWGF
jgi:hypothetical protein